MFRRRKFLHLLFVNIILITFLMSNFHLSVLAGDNKQSQDENVGVEIGDTFRFKYDILKVNGSSKNAYTLLFSSENSYDNLTIREGDIVQIEITSVISNSYHYWVSIEGSTQEKIRSITTVNSIVSKFFARFEITYYQEYIETMEYYEETLDAIESVETFIENDHFYIKTIYNNSIFDDMEYVEIETYIPKGIVCSYSIKYYSGHSAPSFIGEYDHLKFSSLDYMPVYAKSGGFSLLNFITVDLATLITNPLFYIILAELGGLIYLLLFLRKKKATKKS